MENLEKKLKGFAYLTDKYPEQAQCEISHNCSEFGYVHCYFYNLYKKCEI